MNNLKTLLCMLIISTTLPFFARAQKTTTNMTHLIFLAEKYQKIYTSKKIYAEQWAEERSLPVRQQLSSGVFIEIQDIVNNIPVYYSTNNLNAAKTVSTNKVWPGGIAGLNLTGSGITIGEWDGGGVLLTHQEFGGRVTQRDYEPSAHYHSTHVAGTLIASGVVGSAKGMAPEADLDAYNWNNDESEIASAAAAGLLLSNHSYGPITGWEYDYKDDGKWAWFGDVDISSIEDYRFGFYSDQAAEWDEIAFNAPHYLIIKSAGNDRNDDGPLPGEYHWVMINNQWVQRNTSREQDGGSDGYDCVPGGPGVSKNTLTVGAVSDIVSGYSNPSSVAISSFSSWGPTDDGRIKPDLVANGVSLYSTWNTGNSAYDRIGGTSMSAPNVTGSLALLQQHYNNMHAGNFMLSATLKALAIHTADEAGDYAGPDYEFGWGLLNTKSAADVITQDQNSDSLIQELTLTVNSSYTLDLFSNGLEPLKATIVWTDPPGTPGSAQLNPSAAKLINDLDLTVIRKSDNEISYPWILNKNFPSQAAQRGVNTLDNVEQVLVSYPAPGEYSVQIEYNRSLSGYSQDFSLVLSGVNFEGGTETNANIRAPEVVAGSGSELSVEIFIENNPVPIDAFGFKLLFDENMLSYNRTEKGSLTDQFSYLQGAEAQPGTAVIGGFDPSAVPVGSNGSIARIIFDVDCIGCATGDQSTLQITNLVDDLKDFNIFNGSFTYSSCQLGDVNMDETITPEDALCAFRIFLNTGTVPPDYAECDNECALTAADVTCETGQITPQDALCIFRAYLDHATPPMECCSGAALAKNSFAPTLTLTEAIGIPGDDVSISLKVQNLQRIYAFGLELEYPHELLEYRNLASDIVRSEFQIIQARDNGAGMLRIGGYDISGIDANDSDAVLKITFKIKETAKGTGDLKIVRQFDDFSDAETVSSTLRIAVTIDDSGIPENYALFQNYPNPFNMNTEIRYQIADAGYVELTIFNSLGIKIRTLISQSQDAGHYGIQWDGHDDDANPISSGIYIYRIKTNRFVDSKKMIVIK